MVSLAGVFCVLYSLDVFGVLRKSGGFMTVRLWSNKSLQATAKSAGSWSMSIRLFEHSGWRCLSS